ncbi:MAG: antibiotic biosynthesis monooxygenase [Uliginosibacterium sp.]|nr:antibiotic biosynthesis monooxygenase [Uliginosibacterium sp.]
MTVITAVLEAHPGREAELETELRKLVAQVAQEPGALEYTLHRAPDHASRFYFYERYRDQAAVDAHWATPLLQTLPRLRPRAVCHAAGREVL